MGRSAYGRITAIAIPSAILLLVLTLLAYRLITPFDGVQLLPGEWNFKAEGVAVTATGNHPPDLRQGDVVVAVDEQSLDLWARTLLQPNVVRPPWKIGQMVTYTVLRGGQRYDIPIRLEPYPLGVLLAANWTNWLLTGVFVAVAIFIFARRPARRPVQILFLWITSFAGVIAFWTFGIQVSDLVLGVGFWLQNVALHTALFLFCSSVLHFTLIFPSTHQAVLKNRWLIPVIYAGPPLLYLFSGLVLWTSASTTLEWIGRLAQATDVLTITLLVLMLAALITGYRSSRMTAAARRPVRLIVAVILVCGSFYVLLLLAHFAINGFLYSNINVKSLLLLGMVIPLVFFIAIVRFRLFGIQFIINRTLVYALLTAIIVALYVFIVGIFSELFQTSGNFTISLMATGLVAVVAQPLRERLQRAVNQLMYGERDDPYTVLANLGKRLEATLVPTSVFPILVETVTQSLRLPYAAIALNQNGNFVVAASSGSPHEKAIRLSIQYQRETIGQLIVVSRSPGEPLSRADLRLLESLAQQAGIAAYTVRLNADLQHSRERLVTAREEERRRLRRDLHDGLGPTLAGIMLRVDTARNLLTRDAALADKILVDMGSQAEMVIADIRRLVYELRPPSLDELGLISALRHHAKEMMQTSSLHITVDGPERLPLLPAAWEVALYRITLEALTNVIRHSQASQCQVRLGFSRDVSLEIRDNGRGLSPERRIGVGLNSMQERAAELGGICEIASVPGGGTVVSARLPLPAIEAL